MFHGGTPKPNASSTPPTMTINQYKLLIELTAWDFFINTILYQHFSRKRRLLQLDLQDHTSPAKTVGFTKIAEANSTVEERKLPKLHPISPLKSNFFSSSVVCFFLLKKSFFSYSILLRIPEPRPLQRLAHIVYQRWLR